MALCSGNMTPLKVQASGSTGSGSRGGTGAEVPIIDDELCELCDALGRMVFPDTTKEELLAAASEDGQVRQQLLQAAKAVDARVAPPQYLGTDEVVAYEESKFVTVEYYALKFSELNKLMKEGTIPSDVKVIKDFNVGLGEAVYLIEKASCCLHNFPTTIFTVRSDSA